MADMRAMRVHAAILFAPVGALVPLALGAVRKGGSVVCGGIHMSCSTARGATRDA